MHVLYVGYVMTCFQVNLKLTNLEAHLFCQGLSSIIDSGIKVSEVVTDAHSQIISILSTFVTHESYVLY